jgi:TPP-dependent pyruvate/acetoin dehydrogenase alpha subunit
VCEDNGFSEFDYGRKTTAVEHIVDRASGYGMPGLSVDGNDVLAVGQTAREAVERARKGGGPTLIDAQTYRFGGHSVGEREFLAGQVYRPDAEVEARRAFDPLVLLRDRLDFEGSELDRINANVASLIDEAVRFAESSPYPAVEEAFIDIFV